MQDLRRVNDLFGKGAVAITRITDARRALLWSSTLKLQTTAQWITQKKQREEVSRQLEQLEIAQHRDGSASRTSRCRREAQSNQREAAGRRREASIHSIGEVTARTWKRRQTANCHH